MNDPIDNLRLMSDEGTLIHYVFSSKLTLTESIQIQFTGWTSFPCELY